MMGKSIIGIQIAITSGAAVYHNGNIVYAVSEERFTKVKNETIYPHKSIKSCVKYCKKPPVSG